MSNVVPFTVSAKFAGAIYENPVTLEELRIAARLSDEEELISSPSDELDARIPLDE
jgi:hypothetical protein